MSAIQANAHEPPTRTSPLRFGAARSLLQLVAGCALLLLSTVGVPSPTAWAEGSRSLFPTNATCQPNSSGGSCRANIEWRTGVYGPNGGPNSRRREPLFVYAQAGEELELGSRTVGVWRGDVLVFNPGVLTYRDAQPLPTITSGANGFNCSVQRASSGIAAQGMITAAHRRRPVQTRCQRASLARIHPARTSRQARAPAWRRGT
jgi:hypothetical protein